MSAAEIAGPGTVLAMKMSSDVAGLALGLLSAENGCRPAK